MHLTVPSPSLWTGYVASALQTPVYPGPGAPALHTRPQLSSALPSSPAAHSGHTSQGACCVCACVCAVRPPLPCAVSQCSAVFPGVCLGVGERTWRRQTYLLEAHESHIRHQGGNTSLQPVSNGALGELPDHSAVFTAD